MGGPVAILQPGRSVKVMLSVITSATAADAGKFYNCQGKRFPGDDGVREINAMLER